MKWIQRGDEMINLDAARRIRFLPHGVGGEPGPTLIVDLGDSDDVRISGAAAARLWFDMEQNETHTRWKSKNGIGLGLGQKIHDMRSLLYTIPVSRKSEASDVAARTLLACVAKMEDLAPEEVEAWSRYLDLPDASPPTAQPPE